MSLNNESPKMVPSVRLKEFDASWTQHKLGDVFIQTSVYVDPQVAGLELWSLTVENGLTPKTKRYNREFLVRKTDKFKVVRDGDFIYNPMNMTLGAVDQSRLGYDVAVSGYYITMAVRSEYSDTFFRILLKSPALIAKYKKYATGSLIERQRIQFPTLSMITEHLPSGHEQSVIGDMFLQLDQIIEIHQHNLFSLKQVRHWAEQNLLPEPNEATPKVRVGEFDGEWTSTTIGDVSKEGKQRSADGELLSVTQHNGVVRFSETGRKDNSSDDKSNYKWVSEGDLVYNSMRMWQGASGLSKYDGIVSPAYTVVKLEPTVDGNFISLLFKNDPLVFIFRRHSKGLTSDTWNLKYPELSKIGISYPPMEEQQAIAKAFTTIDARIKSEQQLIANLQEVKRWALDNMFI